MSRLASSLVLYVRRLMRSRFNRLKKLSATALSWQFSRRLMYYPAGDACIAERAVFQIVML